MVATSPAAAKETSERNPPRAEAAQQFCHTFAAKSVKIRFYKRKMRLSPHLLFSLIGLAQTHTGFLQLVSLARTANDRFLATLNFADGFCEALASFDRAQHTRLQNFAVETTN